jgi:hypothetical protein
MFNMIFWVLWYHDGIKIYWIKWFNVISFLVKFWKVVFKRKFKLNEIYYVWEIIKLDLI